VFLAKKKVKTGGRGFVIFHQKIKHIKLIIFINLIYFKEFFGGIGFSKKSS